MSDLEKAARDAVEAADNTETVRLIAAVLAAQAERADSGKITQPSPPAPVQRPVGLYVAAGLGGAVALTGLALAAAVLAVAVAVGAVAATVCLLVLKSLLDDYQRRR